MPLPHGDILQLAALIASNPQMASAYGTPMGGLQGPSVAPPVAVPVPGQNAQAVMPGGVQMQMPQPGMPVDQRIDQGFADAGMPQSPPNQPNSNFVGEIMAALQGNAPAATTGTHDGLLSGLLPEGVGNFLGDAAYGAASADPNATPLSTLATAFAGAQGAKNTRLDRKRAENVAAEEKTYQRGRDTAADERADRALSISERRSLLSDAGMEPADVRLWRENNRDREARGEAPMSLEEFIQFKSASGRTGSLSPVDKKAILEADDMVMAGTNAVSALDRALELNSQAYSGPGAGMRGYGASVSDSILPGDQSGMAAEGAATEEFQNVVMQQVLENLKATFGGMPTEGERKVLIDVQGSVNKAPKVREAILQRARNIAEKRIEFNKQRAEELRGGTFYRPRTGPDEEGAGAATSGPDLSAPLIPDAPEPGTVQEGYRYKGGDPADPQSWEPVQ